MRAIFILLILINSQFDCFGIDPVKVTTWNLEHMGSYGRGLSGIGEGALPLRTNEQLKSLAKFIKDTLKSDILVLQEIAITDTVGEILHNRQLDVIVASLGVNWRYVIGLSGNGIQVGNQTHNLQNAYVWNQSRVNLRKVSPMLLPNVTIGVNAFDRLPLCGYFETIRNGIPDGTDFLLVNVHLKSGQQFVENHLGAMIMIEQNILNFLNENSIKESDLVVLGDLNDNPYSNDRFDLLYRYMEYKGYVDLVTSETGATRMDDSLQSTIDHIFVNKGMQHEMNSMELEKYLPSTDSLQLAIWRKTFSDHFPLSFYVKVVKNRDVD